MVKYSSKSQWAIVFLTISPSPIIFLTPPIFQLVILPHNFKLNKQFTTDLCDVNGVKYDEKNRITFMILPLM
jgi:hypothetical protein